MTERARRLLFGTGACLVPLVITAAWSLHVGQDNCFDQRSYHRYAVWALTHGETFRNVTIQSIQSLFNQTFNVPVMLAVEYLPPRLTGVLLGATHGLNLIVVYLIANEVLRSLPEARRRWVCAAVAVVGGLAPIYVSEIGTTFGDNVLSIGVLAAVYLALVGRRLASTRLTIAACVLMGGMAGLKYTNAPFALGLVALLLTTSSKVGRDRLREALTYVPAVGLGGLAGGGWWMWQLTRHYGNPLAPYYNQVFGSSWFGDGGAPGSRVPLSDFFALPWQLARGGRITSEIPIRDARWLVLAVLVLGVVVVLGRARQGALREWLQEDGGVPAGLILFGAVSYLFWFQTYGLQRYIVPLELLSGLLGLILLRRLIRRESINLAVAAALAVGVIATTQTSTWGRRAWQSEWYDVALPPIAQQANALLVLAGGPDSFVVPEFPLSTRYIHLNNGSAEFVGPRTVSTLRTIIRDHRGPRLLLRDDEWFQPGTLAKYHLRLVDDSCEPVTTTLATGLSICALERF